MTRAFSGKYRQRERLAESKLMTAVADSKNPSKRCYIDKLHLSSSPGYGHDLDPDPGP